MIFNLLKHSLFLFKKKIIWSKIEKDYVSENEKRWRGFIQNKTDGVILVDLFESYPWIHFWSYLVNILGRKSNSQIKFFFFKLYFSKSTYFKLYIKKLSKIFNSFNVTEGLNEYNFNIKNNKLIIQKFIKLKNNKTKFLNYRYKNIKIGDLIYDTYLRIRTKPTLDFKDDALLKIFLQAHLIFDECEKFFNENNVRAVIPSHLSYNPYGIIARIAAKRNIPIIMVLSENRGNSLFRLHKVDNNILVAQPPYYNYHSTFKKFSRKEKKRALKIGKNFLIRRFSGKFDKNLPYIKKSNFYKNKNNKNILANSSKPKIFLFPHCYFDSPHCFRHMIFTDFKEQVLFFLKLSKKLHHFEWYYKPHPNELNHELEEHTKILKEYPNVTYLDKRASHLDIIKSKPRCVITNHGTVAHEYAAHRIPVINTGDNKHINYNFCFHPKNRQEILNIILNIEKFKKKLNFKIENIYEFLYMNFYHFQNQNDESKYLKDEFFSDDKIEFSNDSRILKSIMKRSKKSHKNIEKYVEKFVEKNLLFK